MARHLMDGVVGIGNSSIGRGDESQVDSVHRVGVGMGSPLRSAWFTVVHLPQLRSPVKMPRRVGHVPVTARNSEGLQDRHFRVAFAINVVAVFALVIIPNDQSFRRAVGRRTWLPL